MEPERIRKYEITHLIRRRGGKAAKITQTQKEIKRIISTQGSRTKIKFLEQKLLETVSEAGKLHEDLMVLLDDDDPRMSDEWISNLESNNDACLAEIQEYFESRRDDPPSTVVSVVSDSPKTSEFITESDIKAWQKFNLESADIAPKANSTYNLFKEKDKMQFKDTKSLPDISFARPKPSNSQDYQTNRQESDTYLVPDLSDVGENLQSKTHRRDEAFSWLQQSTSENFKRLSIDPFPRTEIEKEINQEKKPKPLVNRFDVDLQDRPTATDGKQELGYNLMDNKNLVTPLWINKNLVTILWISMNLVTTP